MRWTSKHLKNFILMGKLWTGCAWLKICVFGFLLKGLGEKEVKGEAGIKSIIKVFILLKISFILNHMPDWSSEQMPNHWPLKRTQENIFLEILFSLVQMWVKGYGLCCHFTTYFFRNRANRIVHSLTSKNIHSNKPKTPHLQIENMFACR